MRCVSLALLAAPALASLNREQAKNAALDKVVDMLKTMESKAKEEKQKEEVNFTGWSTFMDNAIAEAKQQIGELNMEIEKQAAQMEKQMNISKEASKAMAAASQSIADCKDDKAASTKTRKEEHEAFVAEQTELNDGIYACGKAIETLDAVSGPTEAVSFAQMKSNLHSAVAKLKGDSIAKTLLAQVEALADPFTSAHESKVGVVIEMVETLKKDFEKALLEATQAESNKKHNYDMTMQSLESKQKNSQNELKSKTSEKGAADEAFGKATEAKAQAEKEKASTTKFKNETESELKGKTAEYELRMKSRAEEMTAIAEAVSILEGGAMSAGASNLDTAQKVGSFIQIRSLKGNGDKTADAISFLKSKASSLNSKILMQLAEAASADPFAKVKEMIASLVARLQEEAAEEAAKHGTCTKDMARDKANIEKDNENINKYSAAKDKAEGDMSMYNEEVKKLTEQLEKLAEDKAEAQKLRSEESAENNRVTTESDAAIKALEDAIAVLTDYYSKTGGTGLMQVAQPSYGGGEYKGIGGEGGVMGLLDVIKSDMTALKEETVAAESAAAEAHANFLEDTESQTKIKQAAKRTAKENAAEAKNSFNSASEDLAESKKQLKLDLELKKTTDDMCIAKGESFEEKTAKREAEIQSLKEALEILESM
jgi:hypothetical protein